jgi:hypothetical protein
LAGSTGAIASFRTVASEYFRIQQTTTFTNFFNLSTTPLIFGTNNTERMRIDASGLIGINTTPLSNVQLNVGGVGPSASNTTYGVYVPQTIPAASTVLGNGFTTSLSTAAATFTCGQINHFQTNQATIGSGSIVTNQFGYTANAMIGATNNYGFYTNLAVNPGAQGLSPATISTIASSGTTTTVVTTAAHGLTSTQAVTVAATANATALVSGVTCTILTVGTTDFTLIGAASNTVGVSFTATGAGTGTGTVTINQQGSGKAVTVVNTTTFTYTSTTGTYAAITASGSVTPNTRFNLYIGGTAPSYFAGGIGLGTSNPRGKIEMAQASAVSFAMTNTSAALDNKTWDVIVSGTNYAIRTLNDIYSAASTAYMIGRTDNLVTSHIWYTSNAERMRIDSSGNVGIGTTNPRAPLSFPSTVSTPGVPNKIRLWDDGTLNLYGFNISTGLLEIIAGASGGIAFYTSSAERARIDSSGNVGIGTSSFGTSAARVIGIANGTAPTTSPAGMGQLYVEGGALKYRGSSGTVTTIAAA